MVKINHIGVQPPQTVLYGLRDIARMIPLTTAHEPAIGAGNLGGDHHLVASPAGGDPGPHGLFGLTNSFGGNGIDRIHFGRVETVDTRVQTHIDLATAVGDGCVGAKGHGAQVPIADHDIAAAKGNLFHRASFSDVAPDTSPARPKNNPKRHPMSKTP